MVKIILSLKRILMMDQNSTAWIRSRKKMFLISFQCFQTFVSWLVRERDTEESDNFSMSEIDDGTENQFVRFLLINGAYFYFAVFFLLALPKCLLYECICYSAFLQGNAGMLHFLFFTPSLLGFMIRGSCMFWHRDEISWLNV